MRIHTTNTTTLTLASGKRAIVVGRKSTIVTKPDVDAIIVNGLMYDLEEETTVIITSRTSIRQWLQLVLFGTDSFKAKYDND